MNQDSPSSPIAAAAEVRSPAGVSRAPWRRAALWLAVPAYILTRVYLCFFFAAGATDLRVYFEYVVQGVDFGLTPYQLPPPVPEGGFPTREEWSRLRYYSQKIENLEYPPVAYWLCEVPRRLSSERMPRNAEGFPQTKFSSDDPDAEVKLQSEKDGMYLGTIYRQSLEYGKRYRVFMLLFDVGAFACFCAILRRRRPDVLVAGMWAYTVSTALLFYVLLERFDVVLTFTLLAWAYCWLRAGEPGARASAWSAAAYTWLGLGISVKLIPVILVPYALLCDFYTMLRPPRRWSLLPASLLGPVLMVVAAGAPFAYYYAIVGDDLWRMFRFHTERGVQIESSYATILMLTRPAHELLCYYGYGSWNIIGPWSAQLLAASMWVLLAALAGLGLRSLIAPLLGERYDRVASFRMACVVIPVATLLAKVFSVQYLLWAVPLLLLGCAELFSRRGFLTAAVLVVVACGFTSYLYPYHYLDFMNLRDGRPNLIVTEEIDPTNLPPNELPPGTPIGLLSTDLPRTVLILRNVIFGGLCAALYIAAMKREKRTDLTS